MAIRDSKAVKFQWRTLSDAVDSTNGPQGGASYLQNLVPAPFNRDIFVPRPAAIKDTSFATFTGPIAVELQYVVGNRVYGFVQSTRFPGKSEPFIYDYSAHAFIAITGVASANCPTSTSNTGGWVPPTAAQVNAWVVMTHPGYPGGGIYFGWFDMTGFTFNTGTGSTHTSTTIDTLSFNPLTAGIVPGMTITDSAGDIPANTTVVSVSGSGPTGTITISNAATGSHAGTTLTIAGGSFGAPHYAAGTLNQTVGGGPTATVATFNTVPTAVALFDGAAWYATGDALQFSDVGNPLQQSNIVSAQTINYQNNLTITALGAAPYLNTIGSLAQSLLVFQGTGNIFQVTGSSQTSNLANQLLASGEGTLAPNSLVFVPNIGTGFISPDGLQFVTPQGVVTPAIGTNGDGVAMPFINAVNPSRICAAWANDTLRIACQNNTPPLGTTVTQEFWFHTKLQTWSGPHTFPTSLLAGRQDTADTGGFVISSVQLGASLWLSDTTPNASDSYIENGYMLYCVATTSLLPDNNDMSMSALTETAVGFASLAGMTAAVSVIRENGQMLESINVPVVATDPSMIWGSAVWGASIWGSGASRYAQYQVPWSQPLLFKQCFVSVAFPAGTGNMLGNLYLRVKRLRYLILGEMGAA